MNVRFHTQATEQGLIVLILEFILNINAHFIHYIFVVVGWWMYDIELTGGKIFLSDKHLTLFLQAFKPDSRAVGGVVVMGEWLEAGWILRDESKKGRIRTQAFL